MPSTYHRTAHPVNTSDTLTFGLYLSELSESEGGHAEMFRDTELGDMTIKDERLRANTAVLLENAKSWLHQIGRARPNRSGISELTEASRSALLGGYSEYLLPVIRATFPGNILNEISTVQATTRRTATVLHWNWVNGSTKGDRVAGERIFDSNRGVLTARSDLSSDRVVNEPIAALGGANATNGGTLRNADGGGVRPGTVRLALAATTAGAIVLVDNGNAGFIQASGTAVTISASSINYATGVWSVTISADTFTTASTNTASYRWDTEGSSKISEIDVQLITSTLETERRAFKMLYSMEAMFDAMAEVGVSLEPQIVSGASQLIAYETARQGIELMWAAAGTAAFTFNRTPPSSNYNQQDHFKDLVYVLAQGSNRILVQTQKGYGNFLIVDELASNVIEALPAGLFQAAPRPSSLNGPHFIGTLAGKYRVYKDIFLATLPGASANGNILMGYKGSEFFEAGLAWCPYQMLYTTDTLTTADQMAQKGLASRYAFKIINPGMFVKIALGP